MMLAYEEEAGAPVCIYRFPNVFGKWCRPNYNSAVATFCHNIAYGLPIKVNDRNTRMSLVYIDDVVPDMTEGSFEKKLYSTYLSYLPEDGFSYPLTMHEDARGSFTEILRSADRGQVSINISKPGIVKGNHWHHTKNEKFAVVSGSGLIRFRRYGENEIIEYSVSGEKLEVVDIPTGYVHEIVNTGTTDMVTLMWCNECYDPERPDTIAETVDRGESGGSR